MLKRSCGLSLLATVCASMLALIGCTGAPEEDGAPDEALLDVSDGGMRPTDEAPGFDDEAVIGAESFDLSVADTNDPTESAASAPGASKYHLMILWGHLPAVNDRTDDFVAPKPIDWTGTVSVDAGAINVKSALRFDKRDNIAPRTDPKRVNFVSHTLPAVDGLLLKVVIPQGASKVVHVDTQALKTDIDLASLELKGGGAVPLGDGHNGLAYVGYEDEASCAQGFLFGRWVKARANFGRFRGRIVASGGNELGHVKGFWGRAPQRDKNVFFGKAIDTKGQFHGLFGGVYNNGELKGRWGTKGNQGTGTLEGRYFSGPDQNEGKGFHLSRWAETCSR